MEDKKTIFITSFYGLIGRNILGAGLLRDLEENSIRAVIFLPKSKQETYQKIFGSKDIIFEGIENTEEGLRDKFMYKIFDFFWSREQARIDREKFIEDKKYIHTATSLIMSWLSRIYIMRKFVRWADYHIMPKNGYEKYFNKYKPNAVFATDIFRHNDVDVLREAKKYEVLTIGMVRSWDNVSTKRMNRIVPDYTIVHGPKIREEIIMHGDVSPGKVVMTGVPHYDQYTAEGRTPREEFFKKLNLDPKKKTLLLSPPLRSYSDDPIAEYIVRALEPFEDIQVVIRMTLVGKSRLGDLRPIPGKLAIDAPETAGDFDHADVLSTDDHLTDLLYHCDAIASHISTIAIDAIVFGKPAIYVGFNSKPTKYSESIRSYFDVDCAKDLVATRGVYLAENIDEFVGRLLRYFANPNLDSEGRKKVVEQYCLKLDGNSSQRLSGAILDILSKTS